MHACCGLWSVELSMVLLRGRSVGLCGSNGSSTRDLATQILGSLAWLAACTAGATLSTRRNS